MTGRGWALAALLISGCQDHDLGSESYIARSDEELAAACDISIDEVRAKKREARKLEPYSAVDAGRCTFSRGDSRDDLIISGPENNA